MLFTRRNSPREDYDGMMDKARSDAQKRADAWTPEAREAAAKARRGGKVIQPVAGPKRSTPSAKSLGDVPYKHGDPDDDRANARWHSEQAAQSKAALAKGNHPDPEDARANVKWHTEQAQRFGGRR